MGGTKPRSRSVLMAGVALVAVAVVLGTIAIDQHNPTVENIPAICQAPRPNPDGTRGPGCAPVDRVYPNGRPWAIASAITAAAGVGLIGWSFVLRRRERRPTRPAPAT